MLTGACANGGRETGVGQLHEAFLRFLNRGAITGVEPMPSIARAIHHNLNCHGTFHYLRAQTLILGTESGDAQTETANAPITFVQYVPGYQVIQVPSPTPVAHFLAPGRSNRTFPVLFLGQMAIPRDLVQSRSRRRLASSNE